MKRVLPWALLGPWAVLTLAGCIGTTPEEQLRADQGSYEDGDEEHRPGQPCLVCHGRDYAPGGDVFVVAGTVFARPEDDDEDGLEGVSVAMTDALERRFIALTNEAGNFMVEVEGGIDAPVQGEKGRLRIPFDPVFPLTVTIFRGDDEQVMESRIGRDGSCAACHRGSEPTAEILEKVWLVDP